MAHLFGIKLVCSIEFGACNFISFRSIQNSAAYAICPRRVLFVLEGLWLSRFVFTKHLWIVSWQIQTFNHKVLVSMSREARLWARDDIQSWLKPCRMLWVRESSPGSAPHLWLVRSERMRPDTLWACREWLPTSGAVCSLLCNSGLRGKRIPES